MHCPSLLCHYKILPKAGLGLQEPDKSIVVLCKILSSVLNLSHKEAQSANLNRMNLPIHEWIYYQFLYLLKELVSSGLRFDYQRIEESKKKVDLFVASLILQFNKDKRLAELIFFIFVMMSIIQIGLRTN